MNIFFTINFSLKRIVIVKELLLITSYSIGYTSNIIIDYIPID